MPPKADTNSASSPVRNVFNASRIIMRWFTFYAYSFIWFSAIPLQEISLCNNAEMRLQCASYGVQKLNQCLENSVQHTGVFMDVMLTLYRVFSNPPCPQLHRHCTKINGSGIKSVVQLVHFNSPCSFHSVRVKSQDT